MRRFCPLPLTGLAALLFLSIVALPLHAQDRPAHHARGTQETQDAPKPAPAAPAPSLLPADAVTHHKLKLGERRRSPTPRPPARCRCATTRARSRPTSSMSPSCATASPIRRNGRSPMSSTAARAPPRPISTSAPWGRARSISARRAGRSRRPTASATIPTPGCPSPISSSSIRSAPATAAPSAATMRRARSSGACAPISTRWRGSSAST